MQRFANGLKALGVGKGDVVGIFLPMVPEVVVAMLACARIGAVHNVVFGGFSPASVRERMEVSTAKALVTADEARRKGRTAAVKASVDAAMGDLESLRHIVVRVTGAQVPMMEGRDVFYDDVIKSADPVCVAEPMEAENPLFILYSSGSTAKPKAACTRLAAISPASPTPTVSCSTSTLNETSIAPPTSGGSPGTATSCTGRWPTPRRA